MSLTLVGRACTTAAAVAALALAPSVAAAQPGSGDAGPGRRAPVLGVGSQDAIPGEYIVVLRERSAPDASATATRLAVGAGGRVTHQYGTALRGFAAHLPARAVEALRDNPNVAYIEADQRVSTATTQGGATWGLDRVDQRGRPADGGYSYDRTGAGVTAYIIDTGIRAGHAQFGGRVRGGFTAVADGRGTDDCHGHGTHVAGTVGGRTYGVAKRVTLRPVRVLRCDGYGTTARLVAGIDWVTSHHTGNAPAVANMSLGGAPSSAMDEAVAESIADGVTYVAAAGNESGDACFSSPARVVDAVTVGSTTKSDARSRFSNYGSCVDIFAPGSGITSAWHSGNRAENTLSGTSMAAPHVAGAAALFLQAYPSASPAAVGHALASSATGGVVTGRGAGSPNRLLYSRVDAAPVVPPVVTNSLVNPGFEAGATGWSSTEGVVTNSPDAWARTGDWKAWLGGYGKNHTDTLAQTVTVPSGGAALSFHLFAYSEESPTATYDVLRVDVVSGGTTTTLGTVTNRDSGEAFVLRSYDLSAFAGTTVTLRLTSQEDDGGVTGFLIDDAAVTAG